MSLRRRTTISVLFVILLASLALTVYGVNHFRQNMIIDKPMLDVSFDHSKHKEAPCANCHHNYTDDSSGSGGCFDCHKYQQDINLKIEEIFHGFCRDCHLQKAVKHLDAGPLRQCSLCHIDDQIVN